MYTSSIHFMYTNVINLCVRARIYIRLYIGARACMDAQIDRYVDGVLEMCMHGDVYRHVH